MKIDFYNPSYDVALHFFVQAKLELEQGSYDLAEKSIKISIAQDEQNLDLENATIFPSYFLLGEICYRKGDIKQIQHIIEKKFSHVMSYQLDSNKKFKANMLTLTAASSINNNQNAKEKALEALKILSDGEDRKKDHDLLLLYTILGDLLVVSNQDEAINYYRKALKVCENINVDYKTDEVSLIYKKLFDIYCERSDLYNAQILYDNHLQKFGPNYFRSKLILSNIK